MNFNNKVDSYSDRKYEACYFTERNLKAIVRNSQNFVYIFISISEVGMKSFHFASQNNPSRGSSTISQSHSKYLLLCSGTAVALECEGKHLG